MLFSVGLFGFEWTHAILTRVKSHFWTFFCYKTIFAQLPQRPHMDSSLLNLMRNLMVHVIELGWVQKFCMKNHEKVEKKIMNSRIFEKSQHFSTLLNMYLHMTRSNLRCLSTEKTSQILGIQPNDAPWRPKNVADIGGTTLECIIWSLVEPH